MSLRMCEFESRSGHHFRKSPVSGLFFVLALRDVSSPALSEKPLCPDIQFDFHHFASPSILYTLIIKNGISLGDP